VSVSVSVAKGFDELLINQMCSTDLKKITKLQVIQDETAKEAQVCMETKKKNLLGNSTVQEVWSVYESLVNVSYKR
jgi:hypothetical protein